MVISLVDGKSKNLVRRTLQEFPKRGKKEYVLVLVCLTIVQVLLALMGLLGLSA
jgi:hypothetical protein